MPQISRMNTEPSRASSFSAVRRALLLTGGSVLLLTSCDTTQPVYGPDGNVFVDSNGRARYGYGSPQSSGANPSGSSSKPSSSSRKTQDIKRDPSNTTVDLSPPKPKPDSTAPSGDTPPGSTADTSDTPPVEQTTPPEPKPAAREDLPFGQPVVGKKGFVYSPYAPEKGQVDVQGISAGTKVRCPYTEKIFRVP